jgi:class 3 adenylate cyclase
VRAVLFTDLVGSTALAASIGDVRTDKVREKHFVSMRRAITACGGAEVKTIGDAIMAQFDSAVAALDCAVMMQQAMERDNARSAVAIEMRVGVSMGEVADADGDLHGLVVVEASRLCAAAEGGEVLVADVVRHLAGSRSTHTLVPRPALDLKGFPDPVDACVVLWREEKVTPVWLPRRLVDAARSSCVGRERELEVLQDAWVSVTAGRRRLVLVSGEPGIGKTRLVAELASTAEDSTTAYGWCDQDSAAAYFPWSSIVRSLTRSQPDVFAAVAPALATEIRRLVPELGSGDLPVMGDASITRLYLFDAIDTFLAAVSARQPLLVVLDDLHWADAGTLAIIRQLLRSDRDGPLLIVGTYRDTDVDRTHPLAQSLHDLQREPGSIRVSLSGLERDSVGALIADRAGHAASEEFVDLIYDETEGNPYFAEEVLAHLVESGAVVKDVHGDWANTVPVSDVGVPEGIRDALGRRLSRLPVETNEVLSVAAVVGREFDLVVVGDVVSLASLDVIERLEPAIDAGLVKLRAGTSVGSFAHALVRESLLGELRSTRRTRLHWLIGRAFASRPGVAPAVVAHHLCEGALAGDVGEAAAAAIAAAEAADQLGAREDAFAWSERAIEVLGDAAGQYPELHNLALYSGAAPGSSPIPVTEVRRRTSLRRRRSRSIAGTTCWPCELSRSRSGRLPRRRRWRASLPERATRPGRHPMRCGRSGPQRPPRRCPWTPLRCR